MTHNLKFDKKFFRDFWSLASPYWSSEEKWKAFALLALNIIGIVIGVYSSVALNDINKNFFNAIQNFNKPAVLTSLLHYSIMLSILVFVYGYAFYFNGLLCIRWRRWLTKNYLDQWLHKHNHYHMQILNKNIDNPDQRISEDLEKLPDTTLCVITMLLQALLTLLSFGYILYGLSGSLSIPIGSSHHISLPGYLLWAALLFGIFATWITGRIGKKLANLDYELQRYNANFRFSLVKLRESSEQIAFYRGESSENDRLNRSFSKIFNNFMSITSLKKRLTFFTSGYNIGLNMLGILIGVPLYFSKKIQIGGMMQIGGAFSSVISAFSILVNGFALFAEWRAVVSRLAEFNKSMSLSSQPTEATITINEHEGDDIIINNLNLSLPDGTLLLSRIDLTLKSGSTTLLMGNSGLGKSTLLKALSGLWLFGEGEILFPKNKKIFFLPQTPYLPIGSLKETLLYPEQGREDIDNDILYNALSLCKIEKFNAQLNEEKNWSRELSLGEQQLIGFVRILLHKPDIVFLDESTSALEERLEAHLYKTLRKHLPLLTIISVGHRSSLYQTHERAITLSREANGLTSQNRCNYLNLEENIAQTVAP